MEARIKRAISSAIVACSGMVSVLFGIGLARHAARLPDDWVGIGLHAAATLAFAFNTLVWTR